MPNNIYNDFASVYDEVMADVFAKKWLAAFNQIKKKYQLKFKSMADVGCGTGVIAARIHKKSMKIYLIDQSEQMLKKTGLRCPNGILIKADMRNFILPEKVDLMISTYGVLHYLKSLRELGLFFRQVKKSLGTKGYFCFDYFTEKYIKKNFGGGTEIFEGEKCISIWRHLWDDKKKRANILIEGFQKKDVLWKRHEMEMHVQQAFSWDTIKYQLEIAGFEKIRQFALPGLKSPAAGDKTRIVVATSS